MTPVWDAVAVETDVDGWRVVATVTEKEGRLTIARLEVSPAAEALPEGGMAAVLRRISMQGAIEAATEVFEEMRGRSKAPFDSQGRPWSPFNPRATARLLEGWTPGGTRALGTDHYAQVALDHIRASRKAPSRPHEWLADYYRRSGKTKVAKQATAKVVRSWVYEARHKHGYLEPTSQGRSRPEATPKLQEWIDQKKGKKA
jgi:hypothetical protein